MHDFEKLGTFYLGREYDDVAAKIKDGLLLYDSKDLTTHAVCVGMTGSGKTGLCVGLLEEAAIDGIPAIVIDPKGDLSNLLLTFENLNSESFRPWINTDVASQKGITPDEYAGQQAEMWKKGLADWGQDEDRIKNLRQSADVRLYTPGSSAGLSVSVLKSFDAPPAIIREDPELLREQVSSTASALLNLLDISADPIQSRESILLASILERFWSDGKNLSIEDLIRSIQEPPFTRVGVFELESFFPSKDRFQLAMKINNLIAAPGFKSWMEGDPLDVGSLLYGSDGKPNIAIFSISHLSESERMFFVSTLFNRVLGWMRTQSGTSTLRALLYMDEIFGYLPPVANPPSKPPLMALLKQARAFGLGIVLATQNPADLDYKGLSNAGTWFIGRLQTKQDRDRMLDGLSGAGASHGGRFDRAHMEHLLSRLDKRVFLMNNVHEDHPVLFHTRWVMSYLAGPMSRDKIKLLTKSMKSERGLTDTITAQTKPSPSVKTKSGGGKFGPRPVLKPSIAQAFVPVSGKIENDSELHYLPGIFASARVHFSSVKQRILFEDGIALLAPWSKGNSFKWSDSMMSDLNPEDLESDPLDDEALFGALQSAATNEKSYTIASKSLKDWVYHNKGLQLFHSPNLKLTSEPGEQEDAFKIRLRLGAHEYRDLAIDKLRAKYRTKLQTAEDRLARAKQVVDRETEQMKSARRDTAVSLGTTILSALLGRKALSGSTLGRASTTVSRTGRTLKQAKDIDRARENALLVEERLRQLEGVLAEEIELIREKAMSFESEIEQIQIQPKKSDIVVNQINLVWLPHRKDSTGNLTAAY